VIEHSKQDNRLLREYQEAFQGFITLLSHNELDKGELALRNLRDKADRDLRSSSLPPAFIHSLRAQIFEGEAKLTVCRSSIWGLSQRGSLEEKALLKTSLKKTEEQVTAAYLNARKELLECGKFPQSSPDAIKAGLASLHRSERRLQDFMLSVVIKNQLAALERGRQSVRDYISSSTLFKSQDHYSYHKPPGSDLLAISIQTLSGHQDQLKKEVEYRQNLYQQMLRRKKDLEASSFKALTQFVSKADGHRSIHEMDSVRKELNQLLEIDTRFLTTQQQAQFKAEAAESTKRWTEVSTWYSDVESASRSVVVAGVATVVTGGVGGMVVGLGWGTAASVAGLGGAVVAGTAAATASGVVVDAVAEESMVAQGIKRRQDAYRDFGKNLAEDAKASFYTSLGTATGLLIAGKVSTGLGAVVSATNRGQRTIGLSAGIGGSTATTSVQIIEEVGVATKQFIEKQDLLSHNVTELLNKYEQYLAQSGITVSALAKRYFLSLLTSSLGALSGVKADRLRSEAQNELRALGATALEGGESFAIGAGSTFIETGHLDAAAVISNTGDAMVGGLQAQAALSSERRAKAAQQVVLSRPDGDIPEVTIPSLPAETVSGIRAGQMKPAVPAESQGRAPRQQEKSSSGNTAPLTPAFPAELVPIAIPGFARTQHLAASDIAGIMNLSRILKGQTLIQMGRLPSDHPYQAFGSEILKRIIETMSYDIPEGVELEVIVTRKGHGKDAFALPHGAIFITPELLGSIRTVDEFAALISHELVHVLEGHTLNAFDAKSLGDPVESFKKLVARSRIGEYESDLIGASELLSKAGFAPMAMDTLLERFRSSEAGKIAWDLEHGAILDRQLNIRSLVEVLDLAGSAQAQQPLPPLFTAAHNLALSIPSAPNDLDVLRKGNREAILRVVRESHDPFDETQMVQRREAIRILESEITDTFNNLSQKTGGFRVKTGQRTEVTVSERSQLPKALEMRNQLLRDSLKQSTGDVSANPLATLFICQLLTGSDPFDKIVIGSKARLRFEGLDLPLDEGRWLSREVYQTLETNGLKGIEQLLRLPALKKPPLSAIISSGTLRGFVTETFRYMLREADLFLDPDTEELDYGRLYDQIQACRLAVEQFEADNHLAASASSPFDYDLVSAVLTPKEFKELRDKIPSLEQSWGLVLKRDEQYLNTNTQLSSNEELIRALIASEIEYRSSSQRELELEFRVDEIDRKRSRTATFLQFLRSSSESEIIDLFDAIEKHPDRKILLDGLSEATISLLDYLKEAANDSKQHQERLKRVSLIADQLFNRSTEWRLSQNEYFYFGVMAIHLIQSQLTSKPQQLPVQALRLLNTMTDKMGLSGRSQIYNYSEYRETIEELFHFVESSTKKDSAEGFRILKSLVDVFPGFSAFDTITKAIEVSQSAIRMLHKEVRSPSDYLVVSHLVVSPERRGKIRQYAYRELSKTFTFEEAAELLSRNSITASTELAPVIDVFISKLARNPEELERASEILRSLYRRTADEQGAMVVALDRRFSLGKVNSVELLRAGLQSRANPTPLNSLTFNTWYERLREIVNNNPFDPTIASYTGLDNWLKQDMREFLAQEGGGSISEKSQFQQIVQGWTVPFILNEFHSLSPMERAVLMRKLLADERNGVLQSDAESRAMLLDFLNGNVKDLDSNSPLFQDILNSSLAATTIEERFLLTANPLTMLAFQESDAPAVPRRIISSSPHYRELKRLYQISLDDDKKSQDKYRNGLMEKFERWAFPKDSSSILLIPEIELFNSIPIEMRGGIRRPPLSPSEAIIEFARQFKGPGIRSLQILPMYLPLTPDQRREYGQVYDREQGQSKLAAYQTIRRETPELLEPGATLGDQIAGGSQVTVFDYTDSAGRAWVMKVLNPNAERFVEERINIAEKILTELTKVRPDDSRIRLLKDQLLPDLRDWMRKEINDSRFLDLDRDYRNRWNGFKLNSRSKFQIMIPESHPATGKFVKLDEKVNGKTLTQFKIGKSTDYNAGIIGAADWIEITALIKAHYTKQLQHGVAHSNPTPGNFMLTPDNRVAVIDRSFFLEFPFKERLFLAGLNTGLTASAAIRSFVELFAEESGVSVPTGLQQEIVELYTSGKRDGKSFSEILQSSLLRIKERGVRIPLRYTLLGMNLGALEFIEQFPERLENKR